MSEIKPTPENEKTKPKSKTPDQKKPEKEIGGFKDAGLEEPTRFGDWEVKGRCSDF